ncbi:SHOCT domain-containing protein [Roseiarcus sp.]|uniref:SHOCT domain-containing protein n=1 Tax=Roseiarcus sp. TaxID=1969460 RepID=UPI003F9C93C1
MPKLSPEGLRAVADIAQRTGFSSDAVASMLFAVIAGNGGMAQFSHPEFGGSGQWMSGGAIMLSDMFNNALKARVDALCVELSALVRREPGLAVAGSFQSQSQGGAAPMGGRQSSLLTPEASGGANWWPADLGAPSSVGAQNAARYAYFPAARRLAVDIDGKVTVYDTQDHQIGGFSQQQSGTGSVTFTSQHGTVDVGRLPIVSGARSPASPSAAELPTPPATARPETAPAGHENVLAVIEKLADLHAKGILTEAEFSAKKAELLSRL